MSTLLFDIIINMEYKLPKPPKIKEKVMQPDQRKFCVVPLRAVLAKDITLTGLKVLCLLASYCNKAGFTYVSQARLANDLGVTSGAINQQLKKLINNGYVKQYNGYATQIKGKTKRIVYDENISDREAEQIAGEPKEPFTHAEYNRILEQKRISNNNDIANKNIDNSLNQSTMTDKEIIASIKNSVSTPLQKAMVQRDYEQGIPLDIIKARYIKA